MAIQVKMPKIGMFEGELQLIEWQKNEGDKIEKGDVLATVEGEKITNDMEAGISGEVLRLLLEPGDSVPIGTVIAILGNADEDISGLMPIKENGLKKIESVNQTNEIEQTQFVRINEINVEESFIKASPVAKKLAKKNNILLSDVAKELNITGRIQGDDVKEYLEQVNNKSAANYTETKLIGLRKTIAEHLTKSSRETVPVVMMRSVDITELKTLRDKKKAEMEAEGLKAPSFNDLVLKATALALRQHLGINSTFDNGVVRTYEDININIAVATPKGLVTPVIRNTDKISVFDIGKKAKELAEKANAGNLSSVDMQDGTFTLTNLGMLDIEVSTPILNPPQVGILAVGTIQPYLVLENETVIEKYKTFFSLTLDHRIIDGYPGALFLYTLAEIMQNSQVLWN